MVEYIVQNFNWPTFFLALALFVLVSNLLNVAKAYYFKIRAQREVGQAEKKLADLQEQIKEKETELEKILGRGGN